MNLVQQTVKAIEDIIVDHWLKALLVILVGIAAPALGFIQARRAWRKRQFLGRINLSLNVYSDGKLLLRTLFEESIETILLNNKIAAAMVVKAAKRATIAEPILVLPKDDEWFILTAILNEISEKFSMGMIARDMGLPVRTAEYLFCLSCEKDDDVRLQKVRIMLIKKATLEEIGNKALTEKPQVDNQGHLVRWNTLHEMARLHNKKSPSVGMLELCVPNNM